MKIGMTPERRVQLKIDGGYDKHGDVFVIARPLTGSVSFPVKTFDDAKAREQFIDEFTFFRYGGRCPSWHSVLFASDSFSGEEKSSGTLKGKSYTPDRGKAYVTQLIASGELVVHCTGSWIPPGDRNHHLPWPKPREEEFLPVVDRSYALGPHDGPGSEHPEKTRTMPGGKVVPDNIYVGSNRGYLDLDFAPMNPPGPDGKTIMNNCTACTSAAMLNKLGGNVDLDTFITALQVEKLNGLTRSTRTGGLSQADSLAYIEKATGLKNKGSISFMNPAAPAGHYAFYVGQRGNDFEHVLYAYKPNASDSIGRYIYDPQIDRYYNDWAEVLTERFGQYNGRGKSFHFGGGQ